MANILYGVNGEGSGHSTRAKEVISHLQTSGHKVHVVSFDRGLSNLSASFPVTEIYGLRLAYVNNRMRYRRTVTQNLITAPQAGKSVKQLMRLVEEENIELVITDFEPLSCHVGHRKRLPVIAIDNQHVITNTEVSLPRGFRRDVAAVKLLTRLMTPRADAYIVLSFFPARVRKRNTFVLPPILRQEVLSTKPQTGDYALVYVTSPAKVLAQLLKKIRFPFIAYGFKSEGQDGNILYKKPGMDGFLRYMAVPVEHQFEQNLNAYYLDKTASG